MCLGLVNILQESTHLEFRRGIEQMADHKSPSEEAES